MSASYQDSALDEEVGVFGRKFRDSLRPEGGLASVYVPQIPLNYSMMLIDKVTLISHMATKSLRRYMEVRRGSKNWEG